MRTPELIDLLSADVGAVLPGAVERRLGLTAAAGVSVALALTLVWLQPRPDLAHAIAGGFFWIKAAYTGALGLAGFWAVERLARPGLSARAAATLAALILATFALCAIVQAAPMTGLAQAAAVRGGSWTVCSRNIVVLAAPMLLIGLWVLRDLAPTRPFAAGFAAGVFAGGVAATVYGLHCPEATFVFVALWYSLGVMISGFLGGLLGRVMLRW